MREHMSRNTLAAVSPEDYDFPHCSFLNFLPNWLSSQRVLNANSLMMTGTTPKLSTAIFFTFILDLTTCDVSKQVLIYC